MRGSRKDNKMLLVQSVIMLVVWLAPIAAGLSCRVILSVPLTTLLSTILNERQSFFVVCHGWALGRCPLFNGLMCNKMLEFLEEKFAPHCFAPFYEIHFAPQSRTMKYHRSTGWQGEYERAESQPTTIAALTVNNTSK